MNADGTDPPPNEMGESGGSPAWADSWLIWFTKGPNAAENGFAPVWGITFPANPV